MHVGLGVSVLAANRRAGRSDGIGTYSASLLAALRAERPEWRFSEATFASGAGFLRHPLRSFELGALASMAAGRRHDPCALFGEHYDLFHALDHQIPALSVPVVATVHDAGPLARPELISPRLRWLKNRVFVRKCRFADRIITVSQHAAEEIASYIGIDRSRIHVVYEGVAAHVLREADRPLDFAEVGRRFGLRPGYVAYCGTIARRKNLLRLMEAFLRLPAALRKEHPLVLVGGEHPGGRGAETVARIRELEPTGIVRWLGRLPDEDMAAVVHHATLFVFPSLHEGFGLPVVEAFQLGVPVLASNAAAIPEIAGGAAALVDPESVDEIAAGLTWLLTDDAARRELAAKGRARAREFGWSRCARETLDVYACALSAGR